jgi:hypothetical protein
MQRDFGGVIWTNHAMDRMSQRGISQSDAWATWRNPQQSKKGNNNSWVYYRTYGNERIEVVAKKNERGEWFILSVWSKASTGKKTESFWRFLLKKIFS